MKVLQSKHCIIGEGPIYNARENLLYQVNGFQNEILILDPETNTCRTRALPFAVAAIAFTKENRIIISCPDGVFFLNEDNTRTPLYDTSCHTIRYCNDMKVGPDGRLYVGTQSDKRKGTGTAIDGKLYAINRDGEVQTLLDGLILSNGLEFSMDEKRLYHTDSDTNIIREYLLNREDGTLTYTGREVKVLGVDGFTVDKNDILYVACWGQGHIALVDTATMTVVDHIPLPVKIPASCGFYGKEMNTLAVVTASYHTDLSLDPEAGYTFSVETKSAGRLPFLF